MYSLKLNRTVAHGFGPACGAEEMRGSGAAAAIDLKSAAFQTAGKGRAKRGEIPLCASLLYLISGGRREASEVRGYSGPSRVRD